MTKHRCRNAVFCAGLIAIALPGCSNYVKRDEFDSAITELRAADQRLQAQIEALSRKHDALVTEVAGRIRVETGAHFATGDATLDEQDKALLADFARVIGRSHSEAVVTVEGFADPQGPTAFNRRLGKRRAEAVVDYLVSSGMDGARLRAVSYGEDENRQVRPGLIGDAGRDNRRVSLVIDYAAASAPPPM